MTSRGCCHFVITVLFTAVIFTTYFVGTHQIMLLPFGMNMNGCVGLSRILLVMLVKVFGKARQHLLAQD